MTGCIFGWTMHLSYMPFYGPYKVCMSKKQHIVKIEPSTVIVLS